MRAITLWQPWASLIADGIKTIETRPKRGPWSSAIGETIAIHAAKRRPDMDAMMMLGRTGVASYMGAMLACYAGPEWSLPFGAIVATARLVDVVPMLVACYAGPEWSLPFGAIVATARLVDVVPMLATSAPIDDPCSHVEVRDDLLWLSTFAGMFDGMPGYSTRSVTDQRPFGDYAPGRWALLLDEVEKLPEPIPARGYQGLWGCERLLAATGTPDV